MAIQIKPKPTGVIASCIALLISYSGCQTLSPDRPLGQSPDPIEIANVDYTSDDAGEVTTLEYESNGWEPASVASLPPIRKQPPREIHKIGLPLYRIEPPDVLLIDALRTAPKDPYYIQTLDLLQIFVIGTLPEQPISGTYQVRPDRTIDLGPGYGTVEVADLSITEAVDAITRHLQRTLQAPEVSLSLAQSAGQQQIAGEHLIGPDGRVRLGAFGSVFVAGMTLDEATEAIEEFLSQFLDQPKVSVDVFAYNSKVYYILTEGAGLGDGLTSVPITGNETVLDAISRVGGLNRLSSQKIWIARPAPSGVGGDQILPVDWDAITRGASTATNYQILPGDRVFVAEDKLIRAEQMIAKVTAPFERIFGFVLLGSQSIQTTRRFPNGQTFNSDYRLKKDIAELEGSLERMLALRGVTFEYKDPKDGGAGKQTGMIAQEVEEVFPEWIRTRGDGHKQISVNGFNFEALTVEAFRDLRDEKDNEILDLNKRIAELEQVVSKLVEIRSDAAESDR